MPIISVVIPLYNKAAYIERAINSVLCQSFKDYEIIIVDDGSTDGGGDIVKQKFDTRVRLVRQSNGGDAAARNRGIRESDGGLIALLDADDEWAPGFLEAISELSTTYPEAGIYATGYSRVYPGKFVFETTIDVMNNHQNQLFHDYFYRARIAHIVCSSAQAIPRRVYEKIGYFDEGSRYGSDLDMWGRIALAYPVAYDSRILAIYHNDLSGYRLGSAFRRNVPFPPFVLNARAAIAAGSVSETILPNLYEYLNWLMLQYAQSVVAAGNRVELRRVLDHELYSTQMYTRQYAVLRLGCRFIPMNFLYFLIRLWKSRWISFRKRHQIANGVVRRVAFGHN